MKKSKYLRRKGMEDYTFLKPKLSRLKLSGILETLSLRLDQATKSKWSFSQLLDILLTDEVERRDGKQLTRLILKSGLDPQKTLESFDFSFNPRIHEPTIRELATCQFIEKHNNIFYLGPSGVGKSHLAQAIGLVACRRGHETLYRRSEVLFKWIGSGRGDGTYDKRLKMVCSVPLLILDDYGLKPLNEEQQMDLYEVICSRYEKYSTILTSNRDFSEWPSIFSNQLIGSAAMDRLVDRGIKIVIEGKSYRLNNFIERAKKEKGVKALK
jgi:DNA replication protein DnaC